MGTALAAVLALAVPIAGSVRAQTAADASRLDALFWESVADSDDRAQFAAYLARFPNGLFAELARLKIAAIDRRTGAAPAAAPAAPPPPTAAPAPVASPADLSTMSSADLLASAAGQALKPFAATGVVAQAIPAAPALAPVPELAFPAKFCSAQARNDFYASTYEAAKLVADDNNRRAIAHTQAIQQVYDRFAADRDEPAMTIVSREATAYQATAAQAFRASSAIAARYSELMAVPIGKCD